MSPDLNGELTAFTLFTKHCVVASGTATFAGVDISTYIGNLKVILSCVDPGSTGGSFTASLLDSADNTTFAALSAPTFTPVTTASSLQSVALNPRACNRYIQGRHVLTGTTATMTASLIAVGLKKIV